VFVALLYGFQILINGIVPENPVQENANPLVESPCFLLTAADIDHQYLAQGGKSISKEILKQD
jgi:hypothetical protein